MAGVREQIVCARCGQSTSATALVCEHCLRDPRSAPPAPATEPISADTAGQPGMPIPPGSPERGASPGPSVSVASEGAWLAVTLPTFETVQVTDDAVVLGRSSPDARIANALAPYEDVSSYHVVIRRENGRLLVHERGRFGTWLDGAPLPANEAVELTGTLLRLATYCYVRLEIL